MAKSRRRRTASGYEANMAWVARPATGEPNSHADVMGVDPTRPGEEGCLTSRSLRSGPRTGELPPGRPDGTGSEKSAEAIAAQPGEGRIFNASSSRSHSMNAERQK